MVGIEVHFACPLKRGFSDVSNLGISRAEKDATWHIQSVLLYSVTPKSFKT